MPGNGFFLKKKPSCMFLETPRKLENRSNSGVKGLFNKNSSRKIYLYQIYRGCGIEAPPQATATETSSSSAASAAAIW
jgi:hypothetical protein